VFLLFGNVGGLLAGDWMLPENKLNRLQASSYNEDGLNSWMGYGVGMAHEGI